MSGQVAKRSGGKRGRSPKRKTSQKKEKSGKSADAQSPAFTFTLQASDRAVFDLARLPAWVTYVVLQKERAPTTGKYHFQGYLQVDPRKRFSAVKKALPDGAHIEVARGSSDANEAYCSKPESRVEGPWRRGEIRTMAGTKGGRSDILAVKQQLQAGSSLITIAKQDTSFSTVMHSLRSLQWFELQVQPKRTDESIAFVIWGSTGSGKSRFAHLMAEYLSPMGAYQVPYVKGSGLYWDGYVQNTVPIIDEMDGSRMDPKFFNELVDRYAKSVPIHGGSVQFNSKYLIFTSNKHPSKWWPNAQTPGAVRRRMIILPVFTKAPRTTWKPKINGISILMAHEDR